MPIIQVPEGEQPLSHFRKWRKKAWWKRLKFGQWMLLIFSIGLLVGIALAFGLGAI